jgi:hypothetical protein
MKRLTLICLALLLAVGVKAQVSGGISITDDGVKGFYLAIGQTYHVPEREVIVVHERRIPDEEIPVVFFIAKRAHVRPSEVMDLRLAGQSWMDITLHFRLRPNIYYVALNGDPGSDYGRVYGNWRQPRRQWARMRLDDDDIIKMVNLQFVSSHYRLKTDEVVRLRSQHGNYVRVNSVVADPQYKHNRDRDKKRGMNGNDNGNNGRGNDNNRGGGNDSRNDKNNAKGDDKH